jgi:hypothetical protein
MILAPSRAEAPDGRCGRGRAKLVIDLGGPSYSGPLEGYR